MEKNVKFILLNKTNHTAVADLIKTGGSAVTRYSFSTDFYSTLQSLGAQVVGPKE